MKTYPLHHVLYVLTDGAEAEGRPMYVGRPVSDLDEATELARGTGLAVSAVTVRYEAAELIYDGRPPAVFEARVPLSAILELAAGSTDVVEIVRSQMIENLDDLGDFRLTWEGTTEDSRLILRLSSPTRVAPTGERVDWTPA